ncbi:glycosyltransferase family 1 protein [Vibrio sinensis]|uniref:Glycosyltransferase family 1 protein n=1 Tax=Vibrio sinensis TaxID=2302434 RepID=A0A3A6QVW6_9VIBR|nr:glycosyltransferase family 4 protein [Vibrio sinensis]RJX66487.1 glycosyltransferase family 1 protein [Vibrio sinensis]
MNNTTNSIQGLLFDPISFKGGSKIATSEALSLCHHHNITFTILTVNPEYWKTSRLVQQQNATIKVIPDFAWFSKQQYGLNYWFSQCYFALLVMITCLRTYPIQVAIGASGPGVDMPLYLVQRAFGYKIIQFIHGNVAISRSIGWCLTRADHVFYLPSTRASLQYSLERYLTRKVGIEDCLAMCEYYLQAPHYHSFVNGLPQSAWPSRSQTKTPVCFWAASLLKWKGLDLFLDSLRIANQLMPVVTNICYIQPDDTALPVSQAPINIANVLWFQDPPELDSIRQRSNIYVSTSHHEPFGLSILEALAAGMCVIIPNDGAYWDGELQHGVNCIKYAPNDPQSLASAILYVFANSHVIEELGLAAIKLADTYRADVTYQEFNQLLVTLADVNKTDVKQTVRDPQ